MMAPLVADLAAETAELLRLVDPLGLQQWETMTPAEPWTITDQIGHLAYFDQQAVLAATDPEAFAEHVNQTADSLTSDIAELHQASGLDGPATGDWFRNARGALLSVGPMLEPDQRINWYGPPMRASSFLTARLMETWAHGTDVADALGSTLPATDRLFHVADLGVRTFSWSFVNRSMDVPSERIWVSLRAPSGRERSWNEDEAQSVTGPVEDFCLVVTQRRHVDDTELTTSGPLARQWMEIAQAFAGPPGPGREASP